jgi:transposase
VLISEPLILDAESRALYDRFVPAHHPLRQLDEALNFSFILDLVAERYNPWIGRPAEHPELMWRLLFAQFYLNLSDEKICLAAHESMALRLFLRLNADEEPPHPTTLQKFRAYRLNEGIYLQIHFALLRQAEEHGLLDRTERQIFDTTHVRSNTRVVSTARLLLDARKKVIRTVKEIDPPYGAELEAQAEADRAAYREDRKKRIEENAPRRTKEERAAAAAAVVQKTLDDLRERIAAKQIEVTERLTFWVEVLAKVIADRDKDATDRVVSVSDVEARKGRKGSGQWDGRKLGLTMQEESRLITSVVVTPGNDNDSELVLPALDQQRDQFALVPPELSADKAMDLSPLRQELDQRGILGHIPFTEERNSQGDGLFTVKEFTYDPDAETLTCPNGHVAVTVKPTKAQKRDGKVFYFGVTLCRACPLRPKCQKIETKAQGRTVYITTHWRAVDRARKHNATDAFALAYGKRPRIEAKFSELVGHGGRRCRYRHHARSKAQLIVTVVVVNGKRLTKLLRRKRHLDPPPRENCILKAA